VPDGGLELTQTELICRTEHGINPRKREEESLVQVGSIEISQFFVWKKKIAVKGLKKESYAQNIDTSGLQDMLFQAQKILYLHLKNYEALFFEHECKLQLT